VERKTVIYRGHVQGVGFRWRVVRAVEPLGLTGYVRNVPDGTVEMVLEGDAKPIARALEAIEAVLGSYIRGYQLTQSPATGEFTSFDIRR
jgi:acylphosphatase